VLEGAGMVASMSEDDEDEGQEDDLDDEPQFIRITNILGYTIDYTEDEEWVSFLFLYLDVLNLIRLSSAVRCTSRLSTLGIF
jgi:hypothetical protein